MSYGELSSTLRASVLEVVNFNLDGRAVDYRAANMYVMALLPDDWLALVAEDDDLLDFFKLFVAEWLWRDRGL